MLALPDLRQRDGWSCGPTAAAVVLQYHGRPIPRQFPSASPIDGTDPLSLVPVFRRAGLGVLAGEMSLEDLRCQVRQGRPVICLVRHHDIGHYIIVSGVRHRQVYYQCPSDGPGSEYTGRFITRWWDAGRDVKYHQFGIAVSEL